MKRYVRTAEDAAPSAEDRLNDILSVLKDNFNFAVEGIEKIAADGDIAGAIQIANELNDLTNEKIEDIAGNIVE